MLIPLRLLFNYIYYFCIRKVIVRMKLYEICDGNRKDKMFSCIYLWTNEINGKHYVGQTQSFYNRMKQYQQGHGTPFIKNAINKYGLDNFSIDILEYCDIEHLDEREQYWIDYYESYNPSKGYNICKYASTTRGYKHTEEAKKKMSDKAKEKDMHLFGEANGMYGTHHDEDWKKRQSEFMKEMWEDEGYRQYWTDKMSGKNNYFYGKHFYGELNPRWGKHCSEESKQKAREHNPNSKAVICVETDEEFISLNQAAHSIGTSASNVSNVLDKPNRTCKGFHFISKNK